MQKYQEQFWINELKTDFPEYLEVIELLNWQAEHFLELAEDYFFCKQQIKMLDKMGKTSLMKEFEVAQDQLKQDIRQVLSEKKENP